MRKVLLGAGLALAVWVEGNVMWHWCLFLRDAGQELGRAVL